MVHKWAVLALFCGIFFGNLFSLGSAADSISPLQNAATETTIIATGASFPTGAYKALSFAFSKEVTQYRLD